MHTKTNSNLALVHFQACNLEELEHNGEKRLPTDYNSAEICCSVCTCAASEQHVRLQKNNCRERREKKILEYNVTLCIRSDFQPGYNALCMFLAAMK